MTPPDTTPAGVDSRFLQIQADNAALVARVAMLEAALRRRATEPDSRNDS
jgi:hypothetical protein